MPRVEGYVLVTQLVPVGKLTKYGFNEKDYIWGDKEYPNLVSADIMDIMGMVESRDSKSIEELVDETLDSQKLAMIRGVRSVFASGHDGKVGEDK